jgi:2-polyprenyl-3-methyl-5-hydroxy-6-metoxy-1,4-benzoquinol methylase
MSKASYFLRSLALQASPSAFCCPNCRQRASKILDRKFVITQLRRCKSCKLQFRTPADSEHFSHKFYNFSYVQGDAMNCPSPTELAKLKSENFDNSDRSFSGYVKFLDRHGLARRSRVLDFGCSWGYGSYQFAQAGYETYSYEVAVNRRNYGIAHLGVRHIDDIYEIGPGHSLYQSFDCFFSAHVLEHVPSPSKIIDIAWNCLKPGGLFVAFTPNGCEQFRKFDPGGWHNMWGEVHPNYIDDVFYNQHFARSERKFAARDDGEVMTQYELGFVAKKSVNAEGF